MGPIYHIPRVNKLFCYVFYFILMEIFMWGMLATMVKMMPMLAALLRLLGGDQTCEEHAMHALCSLADDTSSHAALAGAVKLFGSRVARGTQAFDGDFDGGAISLG